MGPRDVAIFLSDGGSIFWLFIALGQYVILGRSVIVNLFGYIPFVGESLTEWIRGDYFISDITLNRFFAFHVIFLPLAIIGLVAAHILALHHVGSNNPDGIEIKKNLDETGKPVDGVAFHPFHTSKDLVGITVFLIIYFAVFLLLKWADIFLK